MSAAKILWGKVLAIVLVILMSAWAATQGTASALGYQPELGEPWFGLFGQPIYRPYDLFWWWFSYDTEAAFARLMSSPAEQYLRNQRSKIANYFINLDSGNDYVYIKIYIISF